VGHVADLLAVDAAVAGVLADGLPEVVGVLRRGVLVGGVRGGGAGVVALVVDRRARGRGPVDRGGGRGVVGDLDRRVVGGVAVAPVPAARAVAATATPAFQVSEDRMRCGMWWWLLGGGRPVRRRSPW
jgi:hypothetical protein